MPVGSPAWIAAGIDDLPAYDATELRLVDTVDLMYGGHPLGARTGVRPGGNPLAVSVSGSPATWKVAPGVAVVDGTAVGAFGAYRVPVPSEVAGEVPPADATYGRLDIIVLRVYNTEADGSNRREGVIEYITGQPGPTPSAPATPESSLLLATLDVPKAGGGQLAVYAEVPYTVASGGILPTVTRPASAHPGMTIFRLDTGAIEVFDGSSWGPASTSAPALKVRRNATQPLANTNTTAIAFDTVVSAEDFPFVSGSTITIPRSGLYALTAAVAVTNNGTTGFMHVAFAGVVMARLSFSSNPPTVANISTEARFTVGQTIQLSVFHNNGTDRATFGGAQYDTNATVRWVKA